MCLSPSCFIFLPCPFLPVPLPRETINKKQVRVFSEHHPQKANLWEEEAFHRCYQKFECCIFCSECWGFSLQCLHLCICKAFGKSYWKHSWRWLPGERQSVVPKLTQKAYSCDEKNELQETMIRNISTIHGVSCLQCVWNRIGSALRDLRVIKITTPKSHLPQVGSVWHHVPLRLLKSPQSCPVTFLPSTTHFWVINQSEMMQYLNQTL